MRQTIRRPDILAGCLLLLRSMMSVVSLVESDALETTTSTGHLSSFSENLDTTTLQEDNDTVTTVGPFEASDSLNQTEEFGPSVHLEEIQKTTVKPGDPFNDVHRVEFDQTANVVRQRLRRPISTRQDGNGDSNITVGFYEPSDSLDRTKEFRPSVHLGEIQDSRVKSDDPFNDVHRVEFDQTANVPRQRLRRPISTLQDGNSDSNITVGLYEPSDSLDRTKVFQPSVHLGEIQDSRVEPSNSFNDVHHIEFDQAANVASQRLRRPFSTLQDGNSDSNITVGLYEPSDSLDRTKVFQPSVHLGEIQDSRVEPSNSFNDVHHIEFDQAANVASQRLRRPFSTLQDEGSEPNITVGSFESNVHQDSRIKPNNPFNDVHHIEFASHQLRRPISILKNDNDHQRHEQRVLTSDEPGQFHDGGKDQQTAPRPVKFPTDRGSMPDRVDHRPAGQRVFFDSSSTLSQKHDAHLTTNDEQIGTWSIPMVFDEEFVKAQTNPTDRQRFARPWNVVNHEDHPGASYLVLQGVTASYDDDYRSHLQGTILPVAKKPEVLYVTQQREVTKALMRPQNAFHQLLGHRDANFLKGSGEPPMSVGKIGWISPWKKIARLIGAFLPLALLAASLTPNIVKIDNTTQPNIVLSKLRDLPIEHKEATLGNDDVCEKRFICESILAGNATRSNILQNLLWNLATRTSREAADFEESKNALREIFDAVRKKDCDTLNCT